MEMGKTVSHYKILEKLGEGGMGVVYKAEDTKLNRTVALKFLPTTKLATDEDKQRFQQEAKAAAQLSHANIATVYEISEHDGETFIAMEYIDGETLAEKIKNRPLKIKEVVKIARQVAEGLHAAHELGIVHRDIKSANIMMTSKGVVKIMDFGLAKMSTASVLTKAGTTLGTISYMSPEQSQGEKVDHRSDIWSFGVVLYEMISGQLPFKVASFSGGRGSATWARDHTIIYTDENVLKRIPESGGEPVILTKTKQERERHVFPHMLPDGNTVLFTVSYAGAELDTYRLAVYRFGDEEYRVLLGEEGYNAVYSPSGHILYGRAERLMAVPFDLKTLTVAGLPVPVLDNVQTNGNTRSMSYALSGEGTIVYVPGTGSDTNVRSVLHVDLSGKATDFFDLKKGFEFARYSPDGNYVAFVIEEQNDSNIWIYHVEGEALNPLTFYEGGPERFAWSPDSKTLAYATQDEDATNSIYIKNVDGTGTAQKIYTSPLEGIMRAKDWSGDSDKISFEQQGDLFVYSF